MASVTAGMDAVGRAVDGERGQTLAELRGHSIVADVGRHLAVTAQKLAASERARGRERRDSILRRIIPAAEQKSITREQLHSCEHTAYTGSLDPPESCPDRKQEAYRRKDPYRPGPPSRAYWSRRLGSRWAHTAVQGCQYHSVKVELLLLLPTWSHTICERSEAKTRRYSRAGTSRKTLLYVQ
jgi:hypothetical protein